MHDSKAQRFGELSKEQQALLKGKVGNDTAHIVSGTLEANGAAMIASELADLDAKVIKLERTSSGGIEYQLAIFVDEPEPVAVEAAAEAKVLTPDEQAVAYFVEKGMPEASAKGQVARFGAARVLAMRDKELDKQLNSLLSKTPAPTAAKPEEDKTV